LINDLLILAYCSQKKYHCHH